MTQNRRKSQHTPNRIGVNSLSAYDPDLRFPEQSAKGIKALARDLD
jgi:hypothetical protein